MREVGALFGPHICPATSVSLGRHTHLYLQKVDGEQGAAVNKALDSEGKALEARTDTRSSLNS